MPELLSPEHFAALIPRLFLGMLFFFQGFDALFTIGLKDIGETYRSAFAEKGIPNILTSAGILFTTLTELFGGLLLVFGIYRYYTLYILGANLLAATMAFSIVKPMWDTKHVFPRLAVLTFLMLLPTHWDIYSLDHLIFNP